MATEPAAEGDAPSPAPGTAQVQEVSDVEREERFRLFVECVKDYAIFMLDSGGHVTSWNVGAERIKGYTEAEILGRHFSIFYPRSDVEAGKCEYELQVAAEEGRFEDEGYRLRKDGTRFWANVVITALRDHAGRLVGFGKVTRDLTDRKEAERERLRRARAEERERRREDFLAVLGHELRNPIAAMTSAMALIKLRQGERCERELGVLDRQLTHLSHLLDDLTDVSRTLHDKLALSPKVLNIGDLLAQAAEVVSPSIQARGHRFTLQVSEPSLLVEVDPERMVQVFVNLLNNAAKYTEDGGEIRVTATGDAERVDVAIEDTGIGIAPEFMERLFDLFAQAPEGDRRLGGLGVGLAVVKRLVTAHGGAVEAESGGLGRGSRFTVRLPRSQGAAVDPPDAPAPRSVPPASRRRVLLVDDNVDHTEMMRLLLERLGYEVITAGDGRGGLALAQELAPDVIFLDLALPEMNGFELCRRLRKLPSCASTPIIAVSGYARVSDRKKALDAGFSDHVAKPFDVSRLEQLIGRVR